MSDHGRWVHKVHPLEREAEAEDPFELRAHPVGGDPSHMLDAILQEFLWMGWDHEQLWNLFHHPGYPVLCELRAHFGDAVVRERIQDLIARTGILRFRETIVESDGDDDGEPHMLVPLQLPTAASTKE